MTKYLIFFFAIINYYSFSAEIDKSNLMNKILNNSTIKDENFSWTFQKGDLLNLHILQIETVPSKISNSEKDYLIKADFQSIKPLLNGKSKAVEGKLRLIINKNLDIKVISGDDITIRDLTKSDYNSLMDLQSFWKHFYQSLINNQKDKVAELFSFPVKSYNSTIETKSDFLRNYNGYFNKLKQMISPDQFISFPHKMKSGLYDQGDCVAVFSMSTPDDEENPSITLVLKAKFIAGKYKFYSLEYSS